MFRNTLLPWDGTIVLSLEETLAELTHSDTRHFEGNRLNGGLAKSDSSGHLYITHITHCLRQEAQALSTWDNICKMK